MSTTVQFPLTAPTLDQLKAGFLLILPRIRSYAKNSFRYLKCPQKRDDAIAETIALAWQWCTRAAARGKNLLVLPATLAVFAVRAAKSGKRLCGEERAREVLSFKARERHQFRVESLHSPGTLDGRPWVEALQDNTQSPVPDQVCFRVDSREWYLSQCERNRRVIDDLMVGNRPMDVACMHGLSRGRVSQLRQELQSDWDRFRGTDTP